MYVRGKVKKDPYSQNGGHMGDVRTNIHIVIGHFGL